MIQSVSNSEIKRTEGGVRCEEGRATPPLQDTLTSVIVI